MKIDALHILKIIEYLANFISLEIMLPHVRSMHNVSLLELHVLRNNISPD